MQAKGVAINDDPALERDADLMAARAGTKKSPDTVSSSNPEFASGQTFDRIIYPVVLQRMGEQLGAMEQKTYTLDEYIAMWEQERGRKLTAEERRTLERGCIGLTAVNLGRNDPPLEEVYDNFNTAMVKIMERNIQLRDMQQMTGERPTGRWVMFAKLFWSQQKDWVDAAMERPDPDAFRGDERTHKVDMSGYKNLGKGDTFRFDYGFWDEESQTWWHANHAHQRLMMAIVIDRSILSNLTRRIDRDLEGNAAL